MPIGEMNPAGYICNAHADYAAQKNNGTRKIRGRGRFFVPIIIEIPAVLMTYRQITAQWWRCRASASQ
jgi:hypothetical protein